MTNGIDKGLSKIAVLDASEGKLYLLTMDDEYDNWVSSYMGDKECDEDEAIEMYLEETCGVNISDCNWQVIKEIIVK